jgi:hypothetical protein
MCSGGKAALNEARYVGSVDARAVDDHVGRQAGALAIDADENTARLELQMRHRAFGDQHGAAALGLPQQAQHVGVRVDDAGRRRVQRALAGELRLERERSGTAEELEGTPLPGGRLVDLFELGELRFRGRDNELAAAPVGNAELLAEVVEQGLDRLTHIRAFSDPRG